MLAGNHPAPGQPMNTTLYVVAALMVLTGLAGIILPILPGVVLIFAGMLLAAWVGDFVVIGPWTVGILAGLTLLSVLVDVLASVAGAQRVGASRQALLGALLGSLVGLLFGLPGLILGPFVGALLGEYLHVRDLSRASQVGVATWVGLLLGALLKAALAMVMLGVFIFALAL